MTTQTFQDIIGKEPFHWRGDKRGIEDFNLAFVNLQAKDALLTNAEMQEFENFLATINYPPNPFRNFDNTLPTNLALTGQFTSGRFAPAGSAAAERRCTSRIDRPSARSRSTAGFVASRVTRCRPARARTRTWWARPSSRSRPA
jgi:hypothetical protein